jgi:5-aminopentanamidase
MMLLFGAMRAGFYQFEPVFGEKERNIEKVLHALKDVDADLIVLPEFFATGYQFISHEEVDQLSEEIPHGYTTETLAGLSRSKSMYIVAGLPEKHGGRFYNSAIMTGPEGFIGVYRKTHLFFEEKLWFTPGDTGFEVFHTAIGRIGMMICFDWIFPESMRTLALKGAELVAHPANLVLPYCPSAMPVRCLENRVYSITANRIGTESRKEGQTLKFIGTSQIISPDSTLYVKATENEESLEIADIVLEKAKDKSLNPFNDLFRDRRPEMYRNT